MTAGKVRPPPTTRSGRSWRAIVAPAAGLWSVGATVTGLVWALTGRGFPFGVNDPRAVEVGSFFPAAEPRGAGWAVTGLGLIGVLLTVVISRSPGRQLVTALAWVIAAGLLLAVPDVRVVQNFAYLFFGHFGMVDLATGWMLAAIAGGVLWAAAGLVNATPRSTITMEANRYRRRGGPACGRPITIVAALLALPYPVVRISWALGIPLGVPVSYLAGADLTLRMGEAGLGLLAVGGAVLTLGLIRPWGEVFPRWIPGMGGRRVPVWFAVIPGTWAAIILTAAGLRLTLWALRDLDWSAWGTWLPGLFFLPWGLAVGAATYAYWARRASR